MEIWGTYEQKDTNTSLPGVFFSLSLRSSTFTLPLFVDVQLEHLGGSSCRW